MHFVSHGRGKGVATYFHPEFELNGEINTQKYQMCKVSCKNYDVINLHRSQHADNASFLKDLGQLAQGPKPCFLVGDFNINIFKEPHHPVVRKISKCGFQQLVDSPTHSAGGLLDHVYVKKIPFQPAVEASFSFYSDHAYVTVMKPSL